MLTCNTVFKLKITIFVNFNFILFFNFTILYWFCHISKWIRHKYTCVPHPEPSSLLPPHTIPLGRPSAPAPSIQYHASNLDWRLVSYMILYMFQCHSPKWNAQCIWSKWDLRWSKWDVALTLVSKNELSFKRPRKNVYLNISSDNLVDFLSV